MHVALPGTASHGAAEHTRTTPASAQGKRTLSALDALTLSCIGLVVVLVSLPRLRRFAVHENETDALRMLRVLSSVVTEGARATAGPTARDLAAAGAARAHVLTDLEVLADGRLRRHGYLFELVQSPDNESLLCAWPWEEGRTGQGVFVLHPRTGLFGHPNPHGAFSGPDSPPTASALEAHAEWFALPRF